MKRITSLVIVFLFLVMFTALSAGRAGLAESSRQSQSSAAEGTIAYVDNLTGDAIRLVEPDGGNDRLLWAHGTADPHNQYDVWSLAWRPDGSELAFAGTHENWCSTNYADIFAIGAQGSGYRRLTEAPSCTALAAYPQGRVEVPVTNNSIWGEAVDVFLYFQGAQAAQQVSLPPGGSTVVVFQNVADFGAVVQFPVVIDGTGAERAVLASGTADVQAGATVRTGTVYVPGGTELGRENHAPTWRPAGTHVGYISGFNSLKQIPAQPAPLQPGAALIAASGAQLPDFANLLAWGPAPARANQLLYAAYEAFDHTGIYLVDEGSGGAGTPLVTYDATTFVSFIRGLAWLPDGSGFVFSRLEDDFYTPVSANLYLYTFAAGAATPLTAFDDSFAGQLSVSPDGQTVVFERSSAHDGSAPTDLWTINRNGSGLQLLVEDGRAPAWGPGVTPQQPLEHAVYLPQLSRD